MLSPALLEESAFDEAIKARLNGTIWGRSGVAQALYGAALRLGEVLARARISANALTYASLVLALGAAVSVAAGQFVLAAGCVLLSGCCDLLDGVVARASHRATKFGALLDSTIDRFADALPLLGMSYFYLIDGGIALIPVLAAITGFGISYVRARAEGLGVRLPPLFMRRPERVLLLVVSILLGAVALPGPIAAPLMLSAVSLLTVLNAVGCVLGIRAARTMLESTELDSSMLEPGTLEKMALGPGQTTRSSLTTHPNPDEQKLPIDLSC